MSLFETVRIALSSLGNNKLRSGLTMLGIIIGVAAIIMVIAIGQGGRALVVSELEGIGSNLLWVYRERGYPPGKKDLTFQDSKAISKLCPSVKRVTPVMFVVGEVLSGEFYENSQETLLVSTVSSFPLVRKSKVEKGRFILPSDLKKGEKICILGEEMGRKAFGEGNPLGKDIIIEGEKFTVVGVMKKKKKGIIAQDIIDNESIFIPITTAQKLVNIRIIDLIYVQAKSADLVRKTAKKVTQILEERHKAKGGFGIQVLEEAVNYYKIITAIFALLIASIAAVSLIVGGIGIMNIMLVSVSERTREIGLRKALGARRKDILIQFLIESVVLSIIGGFIGILAGIGGSLFISKIAATFIKEIPHWPSPVSLKSILLAFFFSAAVGIFFGLYPANKASKLPPTEALRWE
ncbi:MAG: hypothetical protein COS84_09560 [Armatimonadetes bacterium CG07_land_8_20_14_0_80_40_9]|nr:MAG: hypothetical protein COS84_09560 [Armatimonadetes bacterium CG07_land_8_20_14_0_80_40_9]